MKWLFDYTFSPFDMASVVVVGVVLREFGWLMFIPCVVLAVVASRLGQKKWGTQ